MLKHVTEFRDGKAARALSQKIHEVAQGLPPLRIMEVCGGHTTSIFKHGIRDLLPSNIDLLSGPGCPVCVTDTSFIDTAIALARRPGMIIATFGDMIRVPGSKSSLMAEKAAGADVRICYSTLDALEIARKQPHLQVVFLGIGFETTAPTVAAAILQAHEDGIRNFTVLSALKTMPEALRALVRSGELALSAFICPGHVTAVTGSGIYDFLAREFRLPCVVAGFEPLDLLHSILMIVTQIRGGRAVVENQYSRAIGNEGNVAAQSLLRQVFAPTDVRWRGLGIISGSGLAIASAYLEHDAGSRFPVEIEAPHDNPACICGAIMRGVKRPSQCPLFGKVCTPENPKGSCMVSEEGSCGTYFKYARDSAREDHS